MERNLLRTQVRVVLFACCPLDLYWKRHLLESECVSCLINTLNLYCSHIKLYWIYCKTVLEAILCCFVLWLCISRRLELATEGFKPPNCYVCAIKEFTELVVDDIISIVLCTSCWQFMTCAVCRYNPYSVQIKKKLFYKHVAMGCSCHILHCFNI